MMMKKLYLTVLIAVLTFSIVTAQNNSNKIINDSLIVAALGMINTDSLQADIQALQDMGTRFMIAPNRKEVATWIMDKYLSFGIEEVRLDSFMCYTDINFPPEIIFDTTTWQYNVEARIEGTEFPEDEVVLLGHYDDCTINEDPFLLVPGADDNASGTAAVLECARVIMEMGYQPEQTLIFLSSGAEELMYYGDSGTEHYAPEALAAGRNIIMVLNNDMIAYNDGSWTLDLWNHILSPHITAMAIEIIENYTSLNYESQVPVYNIGADIQPFLNAGYHGIYFMEHTFNPNYHTPGDTVENCDIPYLAEVTKVNLGCLLKSDITVGLRETGKALRKISVYPNPAASEISFYLEGPGSFPWDLKIHHASGAGVYKGQFPPGNNRLDVSSLPDGFYMMIFNNGTEMRYQKLVIHSALY
jgi:hypothetical protein